MSEPIMSAVAFGSLCPNLKAAKNKIMGNKSNKSFTMFVRIVPTAKERVVEVRRIIRVRRELILLAKVAKRCDAASELPAKKWSQTMRRIPNVQMLLSHPAAAR